MAATVLDDDWDEYADGAYRAVNNVWNKGSLTNGSGYTQSVTLDKATFPSGITFAWDWNAPFNSSIYAYPEVIFGYKPWDEGVGSLKYSAPIDELRHLETSFDLAIAGDEQDHNVALEVWLTDSKGGGPESLVTEVMVWLHTGSFPPAGHKVGRFVDGDYAADIYLEPDMGDASGDSPVNWDYIALAPDADYLDGTIDFRAVLLKLEKLGLVDGRSWVGGIELGAEIAGGAGSLTVADFDNTFERYKISDGSDTLRGTDRDDAIDGRGGNDRIFGESGIDALEGSAGADRLSGGIGRDVLRGGSGRDLFVFDTAPGGANADRVVDFVVGEDRLALDSTILDVIGEPGVLAGRYFRVGAKAADRSDHLVYDKGTGILFYDPDGSGGDAPLKLARLAAGLDLSHRDILVL